MELGLILGSFGLSTIDENLQKIVDMFQTFPENTIMGTIQSWAKMIGLCLALGVGSYECYMMILGRRGIDVMKLLHIVIISLCISLSGSIASMAAEPGRVLENQAKEHALSANIGVQVLESEVQEKQQKYLQALSDILERAKMQDEADKKLGQGQEEAHTEILGFDITEMKQNLEFKIKKAAISLETKICEWVSIIIRYLGEVFFQVVYYGMLVAQNLFMHILQMFCPIAFAMSLAPPFRSAWSQWLSKYLSLSLWGFLVFMVIFYVNNIMEFTLQSEINNYTTLIADADKMGKDGLGWQQVGTLGMQGLGTTCMYVVALLIGVFCFKFIPEVASWLIPGGVSSGAGGAAVGSTVGGATMAAGVAASTVTGGASLAGAVGSQAQQNMSADYKTPLKG